MPAPFWELNFTGTKMIIRVQDEMQKSTAEKQSIFYEAVDQFREAWRALIVMKKWEDIFKGTAACLQKLATDETQGWSGD